MATAGTPTRNLPIRHTPDGWTVVSVHYSLVPGFDFEAACEGLTDEAIRQELEIDWSASSGLRVFPGFSRERHVATAPLTFDPRQTLYCGWDWGGTPAFVPTTLNAYGQWLIYPSLSPPEEHVLGTYEFAEQVADLLQREYAMPYGLELEDLRLIHFGDPAGAAPPARVGGSPKETRSHFDIVKKGVEIHLGYDERGDAIVESRPGWGWTIKPGAVNIADRLEAVRSRLSLNIQNGLSALVVDPRANVVIEGFLGAYHFKQLASGHYDWSPEKNWWSHTADAIQYISTRLFARTKRDEDEIEVFIEPFVSHAAAGPSRGREAW